MLVGDSFETVLYKTYSELDVDISHDLIIVHRDGRGLIPDIINKNGKVILENKIINGKDVEYRAFGAYRYFYSKYERLYDFFIFLSDDVYLKRDNWLDNIISVMYSNDKLGFGASQIFNGGKGYPHESHLRAPFWWAKSECLRKNDWIFKNDHDGEMKIGDQLTETGYFGIQIGNKLSLGFDASEKNHITQLLEKKYFPKLSPNGKYVSDEYDFFRSLYDSGFNDVIVSPYKHINEQNVCIDIESFNNLIYYPSLSIAKKNSNVIELKNKIFIYESSC